MKGRLRACMTGFLLALLVMATLVGSGCGCDEEECPVGCLTGLWITLSSPLVLDAVLDIQMTVDGETLHCSIEPTYEDDSCNKVGILPLSVLKDGQETLEGLSLMGSTPTECTVIIQSGGTEILNRTVQPQYNVSGGGCCFLCKKAVVTI